MTPVSSRWSGHSKRRRGRRCQRNPKIPHPNTPLNVSRSALLAPAASSHSAISSRWGLRRASFLGIASSFVLRLSRAQVGRPAAADRPEPTTSLTSRAMSVSRRAVASAYTCLAAMDRTTPRGCRQLGKTGGPKPPWATLPPTLPCRIRRLSSVPAGKCVDLDRASGALQGLVRGGRAQPGSRATRPQLR